MKHILKILGIVVVVLIMSSNVGAQCKYSHDKKIVIGFSQIGADSEWLVAHSDSIKAEAEKRSDCFELKFSDAQHKQENQIKAIRSFIAQGVDVIIFSPVVESGFEAVLQEAKRAGIPVILSDRQVDITDDSLWTAFIGIDFVEQGRFAAQWLVDNYEDVKRSDKSMDGVNIVELVGTIGSTPVNDRYAGFREVLANYPSFNILASQSADISRAKGKEVMEAFLKTHGDKIDVLYAHNDESALGAIRAIEEFGYKAGKDIIVVSTDGTRGAYEAMLYGQLNCTVDSNPWVGPQLYDTVESLIVGEAIPKHIAIPTNVYTDPEEWKTCDDCKKNKCSGCSGRCGCR